MDFNVVLNYMSEIRICEINYIWYTYNYYDAIKFLLFILHYSKN